jgi:hypothetical protein
MTAAIGFVLALVAAAGLWPLVRPLLSVPLFARQNFRGVTLPVAAGLVIVMAVLLVATVLTPAVLWHDDDGLLGRTLASAVVTTTGFGLFGLLDDLAGSGRQRGFRGHLGALAHGELTTGVLKLVGGGLVAIVASWFWAAGSLPDALAGALAIALAANLGNLLDRAPGRVGKVSVAVFVVLAVTSHLAVPLTGTALIAGAGVGMLVPDLRERCMLGDTGANVLGAGAGLGLIATTGPGTWWIAAVVLGALNALSERVSFSDVIARIPPLRWLDHLGRPPR